MGTTKIEWTRLDGNPGKTWNPVRGCTRVSPGCQNCYAERMAARFCNSEEPFYGFARAGRWTGRVELIKSQLKIPMRWKKPRRIFVNSMSDTFHESLSDDAIDCIFAVMALCPQHTFMMLTKRAERMADYLPRRERPIRLAVDRRTDEPFRCEQFYWPLSNVWLGVTAENQEQADKRIPMLLRTPAAKRFVSIEPMLGPVDLGHIMWGNCEYDALTNGRSNEGQRLPHLDLVIAGCESGPGRRRAETDWFCSLRDQCQAARVPFFLKQAEFLGKVSKMPMLDGRVWAEMPE